MLCRCICWASQILSYTVRLSKCWTCHLSKFLQLAIPQSTILKVKLLASVGLFLSSSAAVLLPFAILLIFLLNSIT